MMPHEQYRQGGQPQIRMDREAHLDLFRGLRDENSNASLSDYCRKNYISIGDFVWMLKSLNRINAAHASEVGYSEPQRTS